MAAHLQRARADRTARSAPATRPASPVRGVKSLLPSQTPCLCPRLARPWPVASRFAPLDPPRPRANPLQATGGHDAQPLFAQRQDRPLHPCRRLRQFRRRMPRGRGAGRRLGPCRCDGRPFRAQHHLWPRDVRGAAPPHPGRHGRPPDDLPGRSLSGGFRQGRRRYPDRPSGKRPPCPPHPPVHPRPRLQGRSGNQPRHRTGRAALPAGRHRPDLRDDRQPRLWRTETDPRHDGQDRRAARNGRRPPHSYRNRRRRHRSQCRNPRRRRGRCSGRRIVDLQGRLGHQPRALRRQYPQVCAPQPKVTEPPQTGPDAPLRPSRLAAGQRRGKTNARNALRQVSRFKPPRRRDAGSPAPPAPTPPQQHPANPPRQPVLSESPR